MTAGYCGFLQIDDKLKSTKKLNVNIKSVIRNLPRNFDDRNICILLKVQPLSF